MRSGAHSRSQSTALFFPFRFISWIEISHNGKCLLSMLDSHALWNERIYTSRGCLTIGKVIAYLNGV